IKPKADGLHWPAGEESWLLLDDGRRGGGCRSRSRGQVRGCALGFLMRRCWRHATRGVVEWRRRSVLVLPIGALEQEIESGRLVSTATFGICLRQRPGHTRLQRAANAVLSQIERAEDHHT